MSRALYAIGDTVTLKPNMLRRMEAHSICKIVGILPADHGEVQYRVRLGDETFERRIVASDIEAPEEKASPAAGAEPLPTGAWLKPLSSRTRK